MATAIRGLWGSALARKVLQNTGWQITDKLLRMLFGLLVGLWVARYLGPARFGLLNFAIAFSALFQPVADVGLQAVVVRELVRRPECRPQIIGSAVALRLVGALLAFAVACAAVLVARPHDPVALTAVMFISLAFFPQALDIFEYDYQARMNPVPAVVIRAGSLVLFAGIRIWMIVENASLPWFAAAVAGEALLSAVLFWMVARMSDTGGFLRRATLGEMSTLLHNSWPLAISGLSVILYMRIDQVMLGELAGDRAVGVFSAAVRISESWYFVPMAIASAVAPALTAAHARSESEYRRKLMLVNGRLLWLAIAVAALITVGARQIIAFLYGPGYEEAGSVLELHAWAGVFANLGIASAPWFINAGYTRLRMTYTVLGAVVNIGMNFIVIPRFGVLGAAAATLLSYAFAGFLANGLSERSRPLFWLQLRSLAFR